MKKKIIPLLVQKDYKPDGWLGALLGTKLYYKFFTEDLSKTDKTQLLTALGELPQAGARDEYDGEKCDQKHHTTLHHIHIDCRS